MTKHILPQGGFINLELYSVFAIIVHKLSYDFYLKSEIDG